METNSLKLTVDHEPVDNVDRDCDTCTSDEALLKVCDLINGAQNQAVNDAFYDSYEYICELLNRVDYEATGESLGEDLSDVNELRLRLRKILIRGVTVLFGGMCLILIGFATLPLQS